MSGIDPISAVEVSTWNATKKNSTTEEFWTIPHNDQFDEWTVCVEASVVDATGSITVNVYTNESGGTQWETVKAAAITVSAVGAATYTFPDPTTEKLPARYIRIGVSGTNLAGPAPGPEVAVTFSLWLVRRVSHD